MVAWADDKFVAFDFETSGVKPEYALQPWRVATGESWATSLVWCERVAGRIISHGGLNPTREMMADMLMTAIGRDQYIVGWNTAFDIAWLLAYGLEDLVFKARWLDGMLLWRHYFIEPEYETDRPHKKSYGLKACVAEVLPQYAGYEENIDFHANTPEARSALHAYNIRDTVFALRLTRHWWIKLAAEPRRLKAALIEARMLPHAALANLRGVPVDTIATRHLAAKLEQDAAALLKELAPHGVTEQVIRSPTQLAKLLFDDWRLPVLKEKTGKKTGKVTRATDKEVLHELAFIDQRAKQLREYREALNNRTKFAEALLKSAAYNGDGRTRPQAIVFGTHSGRLTYASKQGRGKAECQTGFALHQMKRDKMFRAALQAPEGYALVEVDAAGQEFRWMAIASGDETMLQLCLPGEDAHTFMGAQIRSMEYRTLMQRVAAEEPDAKDARQLGKVANLCVAGDTLVLTDRGPVPIVQIKKQDLVWDGVEFVRHDGVVFSGVRPVISYAGLTATPDHKVLVRGEWVRLDEAARHGWQIESAMGQNWAGRARAGVRIVDGLVRRALREVRRAICARALRLWRGEGREPAVSRDWPQHAVQGVCSTSAPRARRALEGHQPYCASAAEAGQRLVPAVSEPEVSVLAQLRRAWDRVQVCFGGGSSRLHSAAPTAPGLQRAGHRQAGHRRPLRAGQPAIGHAQGEPGEPQTEAVYDILNCGPRTRFSANGLIVHNSLQYRTSAAKLRTVARVQYNLPMELPEAMLIHQTYQASYKRVPEYWHRQISITKRLGYVETFAGRRVQVTGNWTGRQGWSMGSTAINYRIQGTGADQKYLAIAVLDPYLRRVGAYFAWDLHDGIYMFVPKGVLDRFVVEVPKMLANLPYRQAWGFTPPIPLPWDIKAGPTWGALKEVKY